MNGHPHQSGSRKWLVVIVLIVALIGSTLWRSVMRRQNLSPNLGSNVQLGQFDSVTLGLLLGGLRGPLVMVLWSTSESQKNERNLEDFDTKIELIRRLQPEFDAVHIFQIWNKAYNISVQMANLPSKYAVILDAIEYGRQVANERPPNINIESAIGGIYYDKLARAAERNYYRQRVREESLPLSAYYTITFPESRRDEFIRKALQADALPDRYRLRTDRDAPEGSKRLRTSMRERFARRLQQTFTGDDVSFTRIEAVQSSGLSGQQLDQLEPILDSDFRILERSLNRTLLADRKFDPNSLDETQWKPELGELAYLRKFEPYPYGVSPAALGYNYFCRAVALQVNLGQRHSQLSDRVISSRVPQSLRGWSDEEHELGRRLEMLLFDQPIPDDLNPSSLERPTAKLTLDAVARNAALDELIFNYDRAALLADQADLGFGRHVGRFPDDRYTYESHRIEARAMAHLARGDKFFILAKTQDGTERRASIRAATEAYKSAKEGLAREALTFFVTDDGARAMFPQGYTRVDVLEQMPAELLEPLMLKAIGEAQKHNFAWVADVEMIDFGRYFARCLDRLETLSREPS